MNVKEILLDAISLNLNRKHHQAKLKIEKILKKYPNNPDALRIMGEIFFSEGEFSRAIIFFEKSLEIFNNQLLLINNCGVCYLELNDFKNALKYFNFALKHNPNYEDALFNKALALEKSNKIADAINTLQNLKKINPFYISAYHKLTSLFLLESNYSLAFENLIDLEKNSPNSCDAIYYQERSFVLLKLNKIEEALKEITKSIELNTNLAISYNNRGNILSDLGRFDESIEDYNKSILLDSSSADTFANIAGAYKNKGNFKEALENYNKSIELDPKNVNFYINRCIFFRENKLFLEAIKDVDKIISLENSAASYKLKAEIFLDMGEYDDAIVNLTEAIRLDPKNIDLYENRASCFLAIDSFDRAEKDFAFRLDTKQDLTSKQKYNLGLCYLHKKIFHLGWKFYSERHNVKLFSDVQIITKKPIWDLKKTDGILYISNEQGIGDQILFSSLIPEVLSVNHNVVLSIDPKLESLYQRSFEHLKIFPVKIVPGNTNFLDESGYDYYFKMGDLGKLFRNSIESFNKQPKSFLIADKKKSEVFRKKLLSKCSKPICGISWKSKAILGDFKSLYLKDFMPIFKKNEVSFLNLQYGETETEISEINKDYNIDIQSFDDLDLFNDIDSLASLIDACDFIVTTSNVTAHIAGALGKKTYLFSPYGRAKNWYWRLQNDKCLWYPSIIIVEQEKSKICKSEIYKISELIRNNYG